MTGSDSRQSLKEEVTLEEFLAAKMAWPGTHVIIQELVWVTSELASKIEFLTDRVSFLEERLRND